MAITGLALCGFLFFHLAGNLLLLQGGGWFNNYATFLNAIPFLLVIELGLAAIVFLHAWEGYTVWKGNKAARGEQGYYYKDWTETQKKQQKPQKRRFDHDDGHRHYSAAVYVDARLAFQISSFDWPGGAGRRRTRR